uniref:hypothetical protein n=1 Tax=Agathobacter sp. TaxID=2021311 RepID=UPI004057897E
MGIAKSGEVKAEMIYIVVLSGVFFLHLLLKLNVVCSVFLAVFAFFVLPIHRKAENKRKLYKERFYEVTLYIDTLLYAFAKEGKADKALQDAKAALPEGTMKKTVTQALDYLMMTFDESELLRESFCIIEKEYPCKRICDVHRFIMHVEHYGGDMERPVQLLLMDKNRWEKRISRMMAERNKQMADIILSIAVSLVICGVVLYMPVMNLDVSQNMAIQVISLLVLAVDDIILWKGQKYLAVDWCTMQILEEEDAAERKMKSFYEYDEKKEKRLSYLLGGISLAATAAMFIWFDEWFGMAGIGLTLFFLNQHKIGRNLAKKNLRKEITYAFSGWLLDLVLLLQSENVQVTLEKSKDLAPGILKKELHLLVERLQIEPESAEPYHRFLEVFEIPQIHSAMTILYSLSIGNSGNGDRQIGELAGKHLELLDITEEEKIRNMGSGMYLLFLAPVLSASFKLLADMAFMMLGFLESTQF